MPRLPNVQVCSALVPSTRHAVPPHYHQRYQVEGLREKQKERDAMYQGGGEERQSKATASTVLPGGRGGDAGPTAICKQNGARSITTSNTHSDHVDEGGRPPSYIRQDKDSLGSTRGGNDHSGGAATSPAATGGTSGLPMITRDARLLQSSQPSVEQRESCQQNSTSRTAGPRRALDAHYRQSHRRFLQLCGKPTPPRGREGSHHANSSAAAGEKTSSSDPAAHSHPPRQSSGGDCSCYSDGRTSVSRRGRLAAVAKAANEKEVADEYPTLCAYDDKKDRGGRWEPAPLGPTASTAAVAASDSRETEEGDLVYGVGTCGLRDRARLRATRGAATSHGRSSRDDADGGGAAGPTSAATREEGGGNVFDRLRRRRQAPKTFTAPAAAATWADGTGGGDGDDAGPSRRGRTSQRRADFPTSYGDHTSQGTEAQQQGLPLRLPPASASRSLVRPTGWRESDGAEEDRQQCTRAVDGHPLGIEDSDGGGGGGGVMDVFGYFPIHRAHPEYYRQLAREQKNAQTRLEARKRLRGRVFVAAGEPTARTGR